MAVGQPRIRERLAAAGIVRWRWGAPALVLVLAALHRLIVEVVGGAVEPAWRPFAELGLYTLTGSVVIVVGLTWLARLVRQRVRAEADLEQTAGDLARLREQLYLLQELGRQAANAADPQEVFALAGRLPVNLLGARATAVVSFEPKERRATLEMVWGLSGEAIAALRRAIDSGWPAEACSRCQPLRARVLDSCPLLTPLVRAQCADGLRSVVCLPLGRGADRQAVVASYVDADPPWERVQLVNILAAELSTALESVQLRSRRVATLAAGDRDIPLGGDLDALLERALDTLMEGWGAQAGALLIAEDGGDKWEMRAHRGLGAGARAPGVERAQRWAEEARASGESPSWPELASDDPLRSAVVVLLVAEGQKLGALVLGATGTGVFHRGQRALLLALGHQLALTVRNAQLSRRVRQLAVLEERYRLAREMHDGLAQSLTALGFELERAARLLAGGQPQAAEEGLAAARRAARAAYDDVREAIDGLREAVTDTPALAKALREHAAEFAARSGLAVDAVCSPLDAALPPEAALHLLRIAQEALTNVRHHAQAQRVALRLTTANDCLELSIADDGRGFDPTLPRQRGHIGLGTMRERARAIDAEFTLATGPGEGTRISVRVPLLRSLSPAGAERSVP